MTKEYISSDEALANLEKAAADVLELALATQGGVGMACFLTMREQSEAFEKAGAKRAAAQAIVNAVADFRKTHGAFK